LRKIRHVFLLSTPLHIKIAQIINSSIKDSIFIFFNRKGETPLPINYQVIDIDLFTISLKPFVKQLSTLKRIDDALDQLYFSNKIFIYYPNDQGMEFQFGISYFFKKVNLSVELNMFEDGIGSQINRKCFKYQNKKLLRRMKPMLFHLLFNDRYFNIDGFRGTVADKYWGFSNQSFYQERIQYKKNFYLIDMNNLKTQTQTQKNMIDNERYILLTTCVIEDKIFSKEQWFQYIQQIVKEIAIKTDTIYIKPHPRELNENIINLKKIFDKSFKKVYYIESSIPIEEYIMKISNKNKILLFGFMSSALYYSKILFPELTIKIYFFDMIGSINNRYLNCYIKSFKKLCLDKKIKL